MGFKRFFYDHLIEFSAFIFAVGVFFLPVSFIYTFYKDTAYNMSVYGDFILTLDTWNYLILPASVLAVLVGGGYLVHLLLLRKEFFELIDTKSKATFVRNRYRIEELAWKLGPKYESLVIDKKIELKVR